MTNNDVNIYGTVLEIQDNYCIVEFYVDEYGYIDREVEKSILREIDCDYEGAKICLTGNNHIGYKFIAELVDDIEDDMSDFDEWADKMRKLLMR